MSSLFGFEFTTQDGHVLTVTSDPSPSLDTYVTVEDEHGEESMRLRSLVQARRDFDARGGKPGVVRLRSTSKRRKHVARTRTKPDAKKDVKTDVASLAVKVGKAAKEAEEKAKETAKALPRDPEADPWASSKQWLLDQLKEAGPDGIAMKDLVHRLNPDNVDLKKAKAKNVEFPVRYNGSGFYLSETLDKLADDGFKVIKPSRGILLLLEQ